MRPLCETALHNGTRLRKVTMRFLHCALDDGGQSRPKVELARENVDDDANGFEQAFDRCITDKRRFMTSLAKGHRRCHQWW